MDLYNIKIVLAQLQGLITPAQAALEQAETEAKEIKELSAKKLEMETAYRQAHAERAQIAEEIKGLKASYAKVRDDLNARYAKQQEDLDAQIETSRARAVELIQGHAAQLKQSEADRAKTISEYEATAVALEARVAKATAALAALKGA